MTMLPQCNHIHEPHERLFTRKSICGACGHPTFTTYQRASDVAALERRLAWFKKVVPIIKKLIRLDITYRTDLEEWLAAEPKE